MKTKQKTTQWSFLWLNWQIGLNILDVGVCVHITQMPSSQVSWPGGIYIDLIRQCPHVMFFVCLIACFFFLLSWHTELNIGSLSGTSRLHMTEDFPSDWRWMTSWRGKSNLLLRCLVNCQYLSRRFSCYLNKNLNVSLFFIHFSDKFLFFHIKSSK